MKKIKQFAVNSKLRAGINASLVSVALTSLSYATPFQLNISNTPLELTPTVTANVMILLDDTGSMDFEIMTADALSAGLFFGPDPDGSNFGSTNPVLQITQRPGCELKAAAFGGYAYGIATPTNQYQDDCYVADENAWRFRCSSFNKLYYNPEVQYTPWLGFKEDDTAFTNVLVTAAPLDPYKVSSPTINFTQAPDAATGIDKFRYYTCSRDENGNFTLDSEVLLENSTSELQNFANWFSYHRSRHLRVKALLGEYIFNENNARVGLVQINSPNNIEAKELNINATEGDKRLLLRALYSSSPDTIPAIVGEESPIVDRYEETRDYLACGNSDVFPGLSASSPGNAGCPAESAPAGTCQANHIIVASDGFYDRIENVGNNDIDGPGNFDGPPFADNISDTFADLAISFYEDDLHSDLPDEVMPEPAEINISNLDADDRLHQHIKTHIVTIQAPLKSDVAATPPWVNNPRTSDLGLLQDLVHAAFNARGRYIDVAAQSVSMAANDLSQSIATGLGSTTPVAINTQATSSSLVLYRTFYDSFSNSGDLVAQEITVNTNGTLNVSDGTASSFLWSAAKQLDVLVGDNGASNSQRTIFTFSNSANDGIDFEFNDLDSSQQAALNNPVPTRAVPLPIGSERLSYLRGLTQREGTSFIDGQFRIRPETDSTGGGIIHHAKLGTIANAAPVFVGQPQAVNRFGGAWPSAEGETYFDFQSQQTGRDGSVLVAANDGMFHIFNAENGNERFAYVPSMVFEKLSELTRPEYKHQFFVDSTPSVEDAYIRADGSSGQSWNTIVVGGLGAGGRGYYALNITNTGPENDPANQVMWEFGPEDDTDSGGDKNNSDLGFSFGRPLIAMSNATDAGNKRWVAVFGNGYNSTSTDGDAVIYMLFIDRGIDGIWSNSDLVKINTGAEGNGTPNGIADVRAVDLDGNGTIDRLYAGDLRGNLHVVNILSTDPSDWDNSSNRFILLKATAPNGDEQPITTRPIVVNNENDDGVIVVVTTGSYFTEDDAVDEGIQSIYGVFDQTAALPTPSVGSQVSISNMTEQTLTNNIFIDAAAGINTEVRTITDNPINSGRLGWYIDFNVRDELNNIEFPGEKAVRALQLRNNVLFVNTIIPQPMSCDPSHGGFSLAIDPQDGTAGQEVIFDINTDNVFDSNDKINVAGQLKVIVGTRFKSTPSDSTFFGDYRITQLSDTDIHSIRTNTAQTQLVGRQAWREVEF
jgi:type IV pilus assembly protein PilY1